MIQNEKSKKLEVCLFNIGSGTTVTTNGNVSTDSYGIRGAFLLKLLKHFEQSCGTLEIADSLDLDKIHVIGIQIAKTSTGIRWAKKYIKINPNIFQKCITNIINTKEYYGNPKSKTCTVNYCSCYNNCEYRDITLENIENYWCEIIIKPCLKVQGFIYIKFSAAVVQKHQIQLYHRTVQLVNHNF